MYICDHAKYQLYFADDLILLINTKPNKRNPINVKITPADCSLLTHESHICLDDVFCYLDEFEILEVSALSDRTLRELKVKISMSITIAQNKINRIVAIIDKHLSEKMLQR